MSDVGFGALSVDITGNEASLVAALKNAEGALASTQARMNRTLAGLEKAFGSVGSALKNVLGPVFSLKGAFAALVGGAGVAGLTAMARGAIDAADAILDMSERIGISTDALQEMMFVASQSGLSVEQLETGLRKLNEVIASGAAGEKNNILKQLGIAAKDAAGNVRPLTDVVLDVADAFQRVGPQSAAGIKILTEAFGSRAGTAFAGALKDGAAGVRQLIDDAHRLGLVLENDLLRGASNANDALDRMKMIVGTNLTRVLLQLAPSIEKVAQAFADAAPHIRDFADGVSRVLFGLQGVSLQGLAKELKDVNDQLAREDRLDAQAALPSLGINLRGNAVRNQLLLRKAEIEALIELENERLRAQSTQSTQGTGKVPAGMQQGRPEANKMAEYLEGLRQAAALAGLEADERQVLEAILRAEALAREQVANGQRKTAELSAEELDAIERNIRLEQEATRINADKKKLQEEGKQLYESTRTAAEQYADTLDRINQLLTAGAIKEDVANRARAQAKETFDKADEGAKQAKEASDQLAISFKSAFEEAVAGGANIGDIFEALIQDIIKMIVQLYILKPLLNAIAKQMESILGGGSGGGGFGNIFSSIFGGSSGGNLGFDGGAGGSWLNFATGGSFMVGGSGGTDSQLVAFRASPNERVDVSTPGQAARGRGGDTTVIVNNKTDGKASAKEEQGPNMEKMIIVTVEKEMRRPGGKLNRAMGDTFGVRTKLVNRG